MTSPLFTDRRPECNDAFDNDLAVSPRARPLVVHPPELPTAPT